MAGIKDIAKLSGVSVTTVSRALNGYSDVSEATRERIRNAAKQLHYTPNIHAKNLVMQKSNRIGFIVFDFGLAAGEDNFVYELMIGMHQMCLQTGFELIFLFGNIMKESNTDLGKLMVQYDLCGLVIMGCGSDTSPYNQLKTIDKPIAMIDGDIERTTVGSVSVDNYRAAREAVDYLIEKKQRKRILLINGKRDSFASLERERGYRDALGENYRPDDVYFAEYHDTEAAEIINTLFEKGSFDYDAVFTTSDMMAVGAMNALSAHGIAVGQQVDVIGFDNIPLGAYVSTPLTTVAQDKIALGRASIAMLMAIINKTDDNRRTIVAHKLICRRSA